MRTAIAMLGEIEALLHLTRERLVRTEQQHTAMFGALKKIASGKLTLAECIAVARAELELTIADDPNKDG